MKCDQCKKKEATFFYEESINGQKRSLHLCADCAKELKKSGELSPTFEEAPLFSYPDLLGSLFGTAHTARNAETPRCPCCGATLRDLQKSGKVSCPSCYTAFAEALSPTIRSLHGNVTHVGRAPALRRAASEKRQQLSALKAELKAAIENEQYEKAAELRDRIRELEH